MQRIQKELMKKDKMITELMSDKSSGASNASGPGSATTIASMSSSNGLKIFEESKIKRIETELKILKKDRDEFFASRFDKVIQFFDESNPYLERLTIPSITNPSPRTCSLRKMLI